MCTSLELVGATAQVAPLKDYVRTAAKNVTPLLPAVPHENVPRANDWRLFVNTQVEAET
jgi:hypothetical protein